MRKILFIISILFAFVGITKASDLTVYDGTETNSWLPINTYETYHSTKCQFIIPAASLTAMSGSTITGLKFYATNEDLSHSPSCTFDVYMKEVGYTTMTAIEAKSGTTIVYSGKLSFTQEGGKGVLSITLNVPFSYMGGNLLIGIENTTTETGYNYNHYFYGQEVTGAGYTYYYGFVDYTESSVNFIPKTTFTYTAGAYYAKPYGLTTTDITANTASVSWGSPSVSAIGYTYQYKKASDNSWSAETQVTSTSASLSGLSSNTDYNFRVKARYNGGVSDWGTMNFTTDCGAKSLPYTDGFENGLDCWRLLNCATGTNVDNSIKHQGSYSFRFYHNSTPPQYLISPELSSSLDIAVSFWYHNSTTGFPETFQVGYSTTTKDPSAFTWDDEVTANNDQVWTRYRGEYPKETKYVAVRYNSNNEKVALYLDDFSFTTSMKPTNLTLSNISNTSATLSWTAPSGSITDYVYQYKEASEESWSETGYVTTATSVTLTGLTANKEYNFRVKTRYSDGDSGWTTLDFATPMSLPFMDGFENGLDEWTLVDGLVTNYYATGIDSDSKYEGAYAFEFYSSDDDIPPQYLISPMLDGGEDMLVSFWYRNGRFDKSARFQVGYSKTTTDPSAFTWGDVITAEDTWWTLYEGNFPAGTKYVAIKFINTIDYFSYLYIDNFCVENANYPKPVSLATTGIALNSATVSWTAPSGEVTGYVYQYKKASEETWSDEVPVTATSVPFSGLQDNTGYDFRVKAIYDDGASMWVTTHFTTLRDVVYLPYMEGFENGLNGWTMVDCRMDSDTPTGIASQAKHNGDNGFRFTYTTAPPQYLISPELDDASAIKVKFWCRAASSGSETFHVGYSATTPDLDAFTWGDELTISGRFWTQYEKGFPKGTKYIAIKATSYDEYGPYIDDISIEATAYLEAVQPAHTLTAVSWTGESDCYKVRYRTSVKRGNLLLSNDFENGLGSWTTANRKSGTGVKSGVGVDGGSGFLFSTPSPIGATAYQYLISPALSGISDAVELNFYYRNADASYRGSFRVGYSTTTNATDAFSGKETLDEYATKDTDWHLYQLILPADVKYITIESNGYHKNIYIDNISIYNRSAGQWTTITTTDQSAVITGLTPGTEYDIQVIGVKNGVEDAGTAITTFTTLTADEPLELTQSGDNTSLIEAENGVTCDVVLRGRTLYKDGDWNTLCLPFDVTTTSAPLSGDNVVAMVFDTETSSFNNGTLTLNFTPVTSIPAGTPFIIKWDANWDIGSPEFSGVTVDKTVRDAVCDLGNGRSITFRGTYKRLSFDDTNTSILFLGAENTLYYPLSGASISAQRAYFQLEGLTAGDPSGNQAAIRSFQLNLEDEATDIVSLPVDSRDQGIDEWYTLDGRKLKGKPTKKGIYIHHHRKVVVK